MDLGVNFIRGRAESLGFNGDAVRALRPPIVRLVLSDPEHVSQWANAARRVKLKILWCVAPEEIGFGAARVAVRHLIDFAADVSAGLEIGDRPYLVQHTCPGVFLEHALILSTMASNRLGSVILGAGVDGSAASAIWTRALLAAVPKEAWQSKSRFNGLACHTSGFGLGRPLRFRYFRHFRFALGDRLGPVRLAFTRVGWRPGYRLAAWTELKENLRALWLEGRHVRARDWVTAEMVHRWSLRAYESARLLSASHFIIDAWPDRAAGINTWGFYDSLSGRASQTWQALQWRHCKHTDRDVEIAAGASVPVAH